ncbi:hypothetical protein PG994_002347 [Apiospora phragmitis]|uniref:Major facilitator superfamily (MFS) profile domain-containing protein n=1 Tax=Apiospora phragmitis TaxID=2905665 RepID=A0ABR1WW70_9PEZI
MEYQTDQQLIERDGVHVGGWSLRHVLWPKKANGLHVSSEDRVAETTVEPDWSSEEERRLVRRLDLGVLLPCCLIYFFAYLDRANIGNVKILQSGTDHNISKALHLVGRDFNWAVSIAYFPVLFFIVPSNLVVKKFNAKRYLPIIMILFGGISMCIAASTNSESLLVSRFFLGFPESGVVPACMIYFSFWYKPVERAWRIGVFYSANALASGSSGFLAVRLSKLNGEQNLDSWRWVFIIEGVITMFVSIPVYFLLLTFPESSTALNERQRHIAVNRLAIGSARQTDRTWDWTAAFSVLARPSTCIFFVSYTCLCLVGTAQGTFAPTVLHQVRSFPKAYLPNVPEIFAPEGQHLHVHRLLLHHPPLLALAPALGLDARAYVALRRARPLHHPCYATWTWASARQSFGGLSNFSLYGLAFLGHLTSVAQPAALSYRSNTLYGATEQAVGSGIMIGALYLASIISPQMYPDSAAPWYLSAFIATVCLLAVCVLSYLALPTVLLWEARKRKARTGHAMPRWAMEDAERSEATPLPSQINHGTITKPTLVHID